MSTEIKYYRLLQDTPTDKKGDIFYPTINRTYANKSGREGTNTYLKEIVENCSDWFELVEDNPIPYQTYLKDCSCENNGLLIKDGIPYCRWCRKPYGKGGMMNYSDNMFETNKGTVKDATHIGHYRLDAESGQNHEVKYTIRDMQVCFNSARLNKRGISVDIDVPMFCKDFYSYKESILDKQK